MVDTRLQSTSLAFTWPVFFKILQGLDRSQWSFQNNMILSFIIVFGVFTSLLNHGLTHTVYQWLDRVTMVILVAFTLGPTLWTPVFETYHVWIFFACLAFVWSKINSDQEDIRVKSHQASHGCAGLASLSF